MRRVSKKKRNEKMSKILTSKKMIISSVISLILSLALLGTASYAWLSMNKETTSNGMQLKVEVTPNLIIDDDSAALQDVDRPVDANFRVDFTNAATTLRPATHDTDYTTYSTGLKYVTNPSEVSVTTGLAKSSGLTFANAANGTYKYYVDYTIYIASTGAAMAGQDLTATLNPAAVIANSSATAQDTLKATSIDFYLGSVASGNYKGTHNVDGYDNAENNYTTAKTTVTLVPNDSIPLNTDGYLTVVMRCYVDGALLKSAGQAFINAATVATDDITVNVTFAAVDHA